MSIIIVKKDKNYLSSSKEPFNDERLSWEARGIMGYLLSKHDDWQIRFYDLVNRGPAGEHKMRRILKELEDCGYLERHRIQDDGGKFNWTSIVYECSTIPRLSTDGSSTYGLPTDGSSIDGKPRDIVSTDLPSTEQVSTNKENTEQKLKGATTEKIDPLQILAMASKVSYFPKDYAEYHEVVYRMAENHGVNKTTDAMQRACSQWMKTKNKNGRNYPATNLKWIDWAQELLLGGDLPSSTKRELTKEELFDIERAKLVKSGG